MRYHLRTLMICLLIAAIAIAGVQLDFETVTTVEQWVGLVEFTLVAGFVLAVLVTEFFPLLIGMSPVVFIPERSKLIFLSAFPCVSLVFFLTCEIVKRL